MKRFLTLCLSVFFLLSALPLNALALEPSGGEQVSGIDVSKWQGNINFSRVKAAGVDAVYIRSSEGSDYVDPYFEQNYSQAKAAGLDVGFYHYVTARNTSQARQQAYFFVSTVSGKDYELKLAMDFEALNGLSQTEINEIALTFIESVEEYSQKQALIYSDAYNAANVFDGGLSDYPLWIAEYGVSTPTDAVPWNTWAGWQYSDQGNVPGILGYVDLDYFTDDAFESNPGQVTVPDNPPEISRTTITYTVKAGDTLTYIASLYNTTVTSIVQENNIANPNLIYPGQVLTITTDDGTSHSLNNIFYTIQPGDTLSEIAAEYGTTVASLAAQNHIINPNLIFPGQVLTIGRNAAAFVPNHYIYYTVRYGDTLSGIARLYDTTVSQLASINSIQNVNLIYAGTVLRIPR